MSKVSVRPGFNFLVNGINIFYFAAILTNLVVYLISREFLPKQEVFPPTDSLKSLP
jgi:hypothetical protein